MNYRIQGLNSVVAFYSEFYSSLQTRHNSFNHLFTHCYIKSLISVRRLSYELLSLSLNTQLFFLSSRSRLNGQFILIIDLQIIFYSVHSHILPKIICMINLLLYAMNLDECFSNSLWVAFLTNISDSFSSLGIQ